MHQRMSPFKYAEFVSLCLFVSERSFLEFQAGRFAIKLTMPIIFVSRGHICTFVYLCVNLFAELRINGETHCTHSE